MAASAVFTMGFLSVPTAGAEQTNQIANKNLRLFNGIQI